jgi:endogenous inhibitor of DNA gyrase (YacG/DUF329 family)
MTVRCPECKKIVILLPVGERGVTMLFIGTCKCGKKVERERTLKGAVKL